VRREGFEVVVIGREHGTARLGERNDERIDCRALSSQPTKLSRAPRDDLRDVIEDLAKLEHAIRQGVAPHVAL
jgi:hypothetical protein